MSDPPETPIALPAKQIPTVAQEGRFYFVTDPTSRHFLPVRHRQRLKEIAGFYTEQRLNEDVVPLITQKSKTSLRAYDWVVTNYAKDLGTTYKRQQGDDHTEMVYNLYNEYKQWLRCWRRKLFDPFRRRTRIWFFDQSGERQETTVAQLNFLYWAFTHGVVDYTRKNISRIERHMHKRIHLTDDTEDGEDEKGSKKKRKRRELSKAPNFSCQVYTVDQKFVFNSDEEGGDEEEDDQQETSTEKKQRVVVEGDDDGGAVKF